MKTWISVTIMAALICSAAAFPLATTAANTATPSSSYSSEIAAGNNLFAFELLQKLHKEHPQENVIYSPFSISTALAMTYGGSRGNTGLQMADALHFAKDQENFHKVFSATLYGLEGVEKPYTLHLANALWAQKNYPLKTAFVSLMDKYYQGSLNQVDFINQKETARQTINQWVEGKTDSEIKNLIQENDLSQNTRLVLTNAIYFKGLWKTPFDARATENIVFAVSPEKQIAVPMMKQDGIFNYARSDKADLLELPYTGEELSLLILLPRKGQAALSDCLSSQDFQALRAQVRPRKVTMYIPKFKIAGRYYLEQESFLPALGMKDAFSPMAADFSGLTGTKGLYIAHVIHQAMLEIDEAGSKAAAATAVIMNTKSAMLPQVFRADHPFLAILLHKPTNTILFLGTVTDPSH